MCSNYLERISTKRQFLQSKMHPRKEISTDLRNRVIQHRNEAKSLGEIAKILKLSKSSVQSICKKYEISGNVANKPRSGRPKKIK